MIFEVMNARGRPLTDLDLVKNYILYLGTKLDVSHALHDDVSVAWTQILTGLMAADLGAASQEDQLLWAHWMFAHNYRKKEWKGSKSVKSTFNLRRYVGEH